MYHSPPAPEYYDPSSSPSANGTSGTQNPLPSPSRSLSPPNGQHMTLPPGAAAPYIPTMPRAPPPPGGGQAGYYSTPAPPAGAPQLVWPPGYQPPHLRPTAPAMRIPTPSSLPPASPAVGPGGGAPASPRVPGGARSRPLPRPPGQSPDSGPAHQRVTSSGYAPEKPSSTSHNNPSPPRISSPYQTPPAPGVSRLPAYDPQLQPVDPLHPKRHTPQPSLPQARAPGEGGYSPQLPTPPFGGGYPSNGGSSGANLSPDAYSPSGTAGLRHSPSVASSLSPASRQALGHGRENSLSRSTTINSMTTVSASSTYLPSPATGGVGSLAGSPSLSDFRATNIPASILGERMGTGVVRTKRTSALPGAGGMNGSPVSPAGRTEGSAASFGSLGSLGGRLPPPAPAPAPAQVQERYQQWQEPVPAVTVSDLAADGGEDYSPLEEDGMGGLDYDRTPRGSVFDPHHHQHHPHLQQQQQHEHQGMTEFGQSLRSPVSPPEGYGTYSSTTTNSVSLGRSSTVASTIPAASLLRTDSALSSVTSTGSPYSKHSHSPLPQPLQRVATGERISLASAQPSPQSAEGSFEFVHTPRSGREGDYEAEGEEGSPLTPGGGGGGYYQGQGYAQPPGQQLQLQNPQAQLQPPQGQRQGQQWYDPSDLDADGEGEGSAGDVYSLIDEYDDGDVKLPGGLGVHAGEEEDDLMFEEEDDERFVNLALLSHVAVRLRDKVPRGTHVKGSIPYERAFTGKDIVSTLQGMIQHYLLSQMGVTTHDRTLGLMVARSLYEQVFFYEVEWGTNPITDSVEDVFMFLDDFEGGSAAPMGEREELPTAVVTPFTRCYSPTCGDGGPCYAYSCPRRNFAQLALPSPPSTSSLAVPEVQEPRDGTRENWRDNIGREFLHTLPESEIKRQDIILKIIKKEEMFNDDLDVLESVFLKPLRTTRPPVMPLDQLDDFIEDVFGNFYDLRECSRRLLEILKVRQREQNPVIQKIGDIFLNSAVDFRQVYPTYVGHLPVAEKRLKDEMEKYAELRLFLEQCSRSPAARRMDLKFFISRPSEHLQRYPVVLQALLQETLVGSPDGDYLFEALQAIRRLHSVAQLMTFQSAMLRGPTAKLEWHDLLPEGTLQDMERHEVKRQSQIFELIKGEMEYVKDLETMETLFVRRLRAEPIIPIERRSEFIQDVFWNFQELYKHHRKMLDKMQEIQREEYPLIHSITEPVLEAALNWRDAYMEYGPHYPIAEYKIDRELTTNPAFRDYFDSCVKVPDTRRQDLKAFVYRPIPRLLRYSLLLNAIFDSSPVDHPDRETIPGLLDILKSLGTAIQAGVTVSETKVKLWKYSHDLVWKENGEAVDLQLQDETRSLIHSGKLLRQPETGFEWNGWSELFVLLFDNYLVMTKPKETKDGIKYVVRGRPIPLELLALTNFTEIPQQRSVGLLRGRLRSERGNEGSGVNGALTQQENNDPRFVYPFTIYNSARESGFYTLYAESAQARTEWKAKLEEALGLRMAVQENNKVLEIETLSDDTFYMPPQAATQQTSWNEENAFTGKVTCSVPFSTPDGRGLIAVGCAEGVWIGLRHDSRSLRRVLALKQVTQCAMLEKFGIFLVLADKSLFAYLLEALVPTSTTTSNTARQPERLNKDVVFFSVGTLGDRTLITYMKKKGMDSVFQVVEPVLEKIQEKSKPVGAFGRFMSGAKSEWFRSYREFFLPSEAYDVYFLRLKIVILCQKGFEIMGLADFKSDTIPHASDQRWGTIAKRFETCRPIGIYRTSSEEFLLCYDEFGIYVGRHGDPSRGEAGVVEWEGKPLKAAFHPPYVLLFDKRFIEIRHISKLHLVQIIPGQDISCIYDGRASDMTVPIDPGPEGYSDGSTPQEARIHAAMKMPTNPNPHQRGSAQHVFELVPTIPLFLPDTLASPSASVYNFQNSPPHSPQLHANSLQNWGRY